MRPRFLFFGPESFCISLSLDGEIGVFMGSNKKMAVLFFHLDLTSSSILTFHFGEFGGCFSLAGQRSRSTCVMNFLYLNGPRCMAWFSFLLASTVLAVGNPALHRGHRGGNCIEWICLVR